MICSCYHCQEDCSCWLHDCQACSARCPEVIREELDDLAARINRGTETLETVRRFLLSVIASVVDDFDSGWDALEDLAPDLLPHIGDDESPALELDDARWCWDDTRLLKWTGNRCRPEDGLRIVQREGIE